MTMHLRDLRLDLSDMQALTALVEADLPEYYPRRPAEERLAERVDATARPGMVALGSVVEQDEQVVGISSVTNMHVAWLAGAVAIWIAVRTSHRRQGIARKIFEADLDRARRARFTCFITNVDDGEPLAVGLAAALGFQIVDRGYNLRIDISAWSPSQGRDVLARAADAGVEIVSLRDLQTQNGDWCRQLYDLSVAFIEDVPSFIAPHSSDMIGGDLETFQYKLDHDHRVDMDGSFVAIVDGVLAGTSWLRRVSPKICGHPLTGVRPEYRRRGLVKALKHRCFAWAQEQGVRYINTQQHESNAAMLALNKQVGFEIKNSHAIMRYDFK